MATLLSSHRAASFDPMVSTSNADSRSRRPLPDELDSASHILILEMQISDINELLSANIDAANGWQLALGAQREELERTLSVVRDHQISTNFSRGLEANVNAINSVLDEERQAQEDRIMACRMAGVPPSPRIDFPTLALPVAPSTAISRLRATRSSSAVSASSTPVSRPAASNCQSGEKVLEALTSTVNRSGEIIDLSGLEDDHVKERSRGRVSQPRKAPGFDQLNCKRLRQEEDPATPSDPQIKRRKVGDQSVEACDKATPATRNPVEETATSIETRPLAFEPSDTTITEVILAASAPPAQEAPLTLPCVSCGEEYEVTYLAQMTCGHDYCQGCLQRVVVNALNDESLYPPRCCKVPFEMDLMRHILTPAIISNFHQKAVEYNTTNRVYCSNISCSTFLFPSNIQDDRGSCPVCLVQTCTICKAPAHSGDCPQDTGVQQVLALATGSGWKRCPDCKAIVELGVGCNHITCRCKSQWCYVCAAPWKTCTCPTWSEERLLARAEGAAGRVAQQPVPAPLQGALPPAPNAVVPALNRPVQAADRRFLFPDECDHPNWDYEDGPGLCGECGFHCRHYYYRCTECATYSCSRCRD